MAVADPLHHLRLIDQHFLLVVLGILPTSSTVHLLRRLFHLQCYADIYIATLRRMWKMMANLQNLGQPSLFLVLPKGRCGEPNVR